MKIIRKPLNFERVSYVTQDHFKLYMKELGSNNIYRFYRKLIEFPQKINLPIKKKEVELLQGEFEVEIRRKLEELFEVESIYQIELEFETLVREYIRDIYLPSPELMKKCLKVGEELMDIRAKSKENEINVIKVKELAFVSKVKQELKNSIYRQLTEEVSFLEEKPCIKLVIELDGSIRKGA